MTHSTPLVVFSDLDGTLLDHISYDWSPAIPALQRLDSIGAPVVLASSKTAAEMAVLQQAMGLTQWMAITENGAGLVDAQARTPPDDYTALRRALDQLPQHMRRHFLGFGDMTLDMLMDKTGLSRQDAALAKQRAFSEPGLWLGPADQQAAFLCALHNLGITARLGGRFLTLSFGATKATRMAEVIAHYRPQTTIALGDAPNDTEMLETADIGVIIANPHHAPLPPLAGEKSGKIIRTSEPGPAGWNMAILSLLDRLGHDKGPPSHG